MFGGDSFQYIYILVKPQYREYIRHDLAKNVEQRHFVKAKIHLMFLDKCL